MVFKLFYFKMLWKKFRFLLLTMSVLALGSCGTAKGVLYGAGTVLEGVASDARTVADWIK
jgi:hypothetical protein